MICTEIFIPDLAGFSNPYRVTTGYAPAGVCFNEIVNLEATACDEVELIEDKSKHKTITDAKRFMEVRQFLHQNQAHL